MTLMNLSLDFAFEGFRTVREKPGCVPFWGLVLLIGNGLATVLLVAIGGPAMDRIASLSPGADLAVAVPLYTRVLTAYAAAAPLLIVSQAIVTCAVFRAVWGRAGDRFGYLRFGLDELRQIIVTILFGLMYCALVLADMVVSMNIGRLIGDKDGTIGVALALAGFVLVIGVLLRLSLCGAQSFDRGAVVMFGSWRLTRGQGWTLFGGYLVTAVMAAFVAILCIGIYGAVTIAINNGSWDSLNEWFFRPDASSVQAYLKPLMIGWLVTGNFVVAPLIAALTIGAQAAAYRTLAGQVPDSGV